LYGFCDGVFRANDLGELTVVLFQEFQDPFGLWIGSRRLGFGVLLSGGEVFGSSYSKM